MHNFHRMNNNPPLISSSAMSFAREPTSPPLTHPLESAPGSARQSGPQSHPNPTGYNKMSIDNLLCKPVTSPMGGPPPPTPSHHVTISPGSQALPSPSYPLFHHVSFHSAAHTHHIPLQPASHSNQGRFQQMSPDDQPQYQAGAPGHESRFPPSAPTSQMQYQLASTENHVRFHPATVGHHVSYHPTPSGSSSQSAAAVAATAVKLTPLASHLPSQLPPQQLLQPQEPVMDMEIDTRPRDPAPPIARQIQGRQVPFRTTSHTPINQFSSMNAPQRNFRSQEKPAGPSSQAMVPLPIAKRPAHMTLDMRNRVGEESSLAVATSGSEPRVKRPWADQEDRLLRTLVDQMGQGLWANIALQIPGRSGKQVRERWLNHLSPNVTKRPWSKEEDEIIIKNHDMFGNCWSRIAKKLDGRSDNSVKNRYYTTLRRRMDRKGKNHPGSGKRSRSQQTNSEGSEEQPKQKLKKSGPNE